MGWGFCLQALALKISKKTFGGPFGPWVFLAWALEWGWGGERGDEVKATVSHLPAARGRGFTNWGEMGAGKEKWMFTLRSGKRRLGKSSSLQGPIFGSGRTGSVGSMREAHLCGVMYMSCAESPAWWAPYRFSVESEIRTLVFTWISASPILALALPPFCVLSPRASKCS